MLIEEIEHTIFSNIDRLSQEGYRFIISSGGIGLKINPLGIIEAPEKIIYPFYFPLLGKSMEISIKNLIKEINLFDLDLNKKEYHLLSSAYYFGSPLSDKEIEKLGLNIRKYITRSGLEGKLSKKF